MRTTNEIGDPYLSGATAYFLIALSWSAVFWTAAILLGPPEHPPTSLLFILGGAGPPIAALALTLFRETSTTRHDFLIRIVDVRRMGWRWFCAALLLPPVLLSLAILLDLAFGQFLALDAELPQSWTLARDAA